MAVIDLRKDDIGCNLGELISASISDDYLQGSGLITTTGTCVINGIISPSAGSGVSIDYIPRALKVMGYSTDPLRNTTTVQVGCQLAMNRGLQETIKWSSYDDPENENDNADPSIVIVPIHASSVASFCMQKLGLSGSSPALTNKFSIKEFDYSPGYFQVLSDLLVSECLYGFIDSNGNFQIRSLEALNGQTIALSVDDVVDLAPLAGGTPPGSTVTVSYSTLKLSKEELQSSGEDVTPVSSEPRPENADTVKKETSTTVDFACSIAAGAPVPWFYEDKDSGEPQILNLPSGVVTSEIQEITSESESRTIRYSAVPPPSPPLRDTSPTYYIPVTKTVTKRQVSYISSSFGQMDLANRARRGDNPQGIVNKSVHLVDGGTEHRIFSGRESVLQARPSPSENAIKNAVTDSTGTTTGDPNNGYKTDSTAQMELVSGLADSNNYITFDMPYAPDDTFSVADGPGSEPDPNERKIINWEFEETQGIPTYIGAYASGEGWEWESTFGYIPKTQTRSYYDSWDRLKKRVSTDYYIGAVTLGSYISAHVEYDYETESVVKGLVSVNAGQWGLYKTTTTIIEYEVEAPVVDSASTISTNTNNYISTPSDAADKARRFGKVQNDLLMGNQYGMNITTSVENMPDEPGGRIALSLNGFAAAYITNGTSYTIDNTGIVVSTDALLMGGIGGGGGGAWFPVAPGVELPPLPEPVNGFIDLDENPVVPLYNIIYNISQTTKTKISVLSLPYDLNRPDVDIDITIKAKAYVNLITVAPIPGVVTLETKVPDVGTVTPYFYPYVADTIEWTGNSAPANGETYPTALNGNSQQVAGLRWPPGIIIMYEKIYRNNAYYYSNAKLFDANGGPGKFWLLDSGYGYDYETDSTVLANMANSITSLDQQGFTVGWSDIANRNGVAYEAWVLRGTDLPVSNTDGTRPSTVRVCSINGKNIYSIAEYYGNATMNATVGHGLGAVPALVMQKILEYPGSSYAYGEGIFTGSVIGGPDKYAVLSGMFGSNPIDDNAWYGEFWGSNGITSTTVALGNNSYTNANGARSVLYSFLDVPGITKVSFYTGDGSPSQFIDCGFQPNFILVMPMEYGAESFCSDDTWFVIAKNRPSELDYIEFWGYEYYQTTTPYCNFAQGGFIVYTSPGGTQDCYVHLNDTDRRYAFIAFAERKPTVLLPAKTIAMQALLPQISSGASFAFQTQSSTLVGWAPAYIGTFATVIRAYGVGSTVYTLAPQVSAGKSVQLNVSAITATGYPPFGLGVVDPEYQTVAILLQFNEASGSTAFTEARFNRTLTRSGTGLSISNTNSLFGSNTMLGASSVAGSLNTNLKLVLPSGEPGTTNFPKGDSSFTIEWWHRFSSFTTSQNQRIFWTRCGVSSLNRTHTLVELSNGSSFSQINFTFGDDTSSPGSFQQWGNYAYINSPFVINQWYHFAIVRNYPIISIYVNGLRVLEVTNNDRLIADLNNYGVADWTMGNTSTGYSIKGNVEDFRITDKVARYTGSTFALPTANFLTN